jgi:hypothetical protein
MPLSSFEFVDFDPAFSREELDRTRKSLHVQEPDNLLEMIFGTEPSNGRPLSKAATVELASAVSGLEEGDVHKLFSTTKPAKLAAPPELTDAFTKVMGSPGFQPAYRCLSKFYKTTGSVRDSMIEAGSLFDNYFSKEETEQVRKAIESLDVTLFLRLLSGAIHRQTSGALA